MHAQYIPNVGPIVATMLPLPVVLFDPDLGVGAMFFAFMIPSIIHFIVGNFVEPAVFGRSMELHPVMSARMHGCRARHAVDIARPCTHQA